MNIWLLLGFVLYAIFLSAFVVYSIVGLYHLNNYGYVGDACAKVKVGYIVISSLIIIATIVTFIVT